MANIVEILIKAKDETKAALDSAASNFSKLGQATEGAEQSSASFAENFSVAMLGINQALEVAQKVMEAFKKAYEFSREGAALYYLEDRFDNLSKSIDATADLLLIDLREATRGMYSDAELMASAADFMALGLANSSDEAVRLASVASALDMNMNQLVLTLTNMTTMRFDAIGMRVDGFKDKVKALEEAGLDTADAFKEAFLQQAEEQIERVGHAADSASGDFMKLEAAIKNFGDNLKKESTGPMGEFVRMLNVHFGELNTKMIFKQLISDLKDAGVATEEFEQQWKDMANWAGFRAEADVLDFFKLLKGELGAAGEAAGKATEFAAEQAQGYAIQAAIAAGATWEEIAALLSLIDAAEDAARATEEAAQAAAEYADSMGKLKDAMGGKLSQMQDDFLEKQEGITEELAATRDRIGELEGLSYLTTKQKEELETLLGKQDDLQGAFSANADAHDDATKRIIFNIMQQAAAAAGFANEQFWWDLAHKWGLIDEATLTAMESSQKLFDAIEKGTPISKQWLEDLGLTIDDIPDDKQFLLEMDLDDPFNLLNWQPPGDSSSTHVFNIHTIETTYSWDVLPPKGEAAGGPIHAAAGANAYWVGEAGPELFVPAEDGRILSNTQSMQAVSAATGAAGSVQDQQAYAEVIKLVRDALRGLNLEMEQRLQLEQELGLLTGEITAQDIAFQEAVKTITQAWVDGSISAEDFANKLAEINEQMIQAQTIDISPLLEIIQGDNVGADVIDLISNSLSGLNLTLEQRALLEQELAIALGETTREQIATQEVIEDLTQAYADGVISAEEYISSLAEINEQMIQIQEDIAREAFGDLLPVNEFADASQKMVEDYYQKAVELGLITEEAAKYYVIAWHQAQAEVDWKQHAQEVELMVAAIKSLEGNMSGIVNMARRYDTILKQIADKESEIRELRLRDYYAYEDYLEQWQQAFQEQHAAYLDQIVAVQSLAGNLSGIVSMAQSYERVMADIADKQERIAEYQRIASQGGGYFEGVWMSAAQARNHIADLQDEIGSLQDTMKRMANQVVLDMFQATLAVGGFTDEKLALYFKMADELGIISNEASQYAIDAYKRAQDELEGLDLFEFDEPILSAEDFSDAIKNLIDEIGDLKRSMTDMANQAVLDMYYATLAIDGFTQSEMESYFQMAVALGLMSQEAVDAAMAAFRRAGGMMPGMAAGGAIHAASGYWVGEAGPEWFYPAERGRILSNSDAMAAIRGGSGDYTVNVTINTPFNFADTVWVERELAPYIRKEMREVMRV